ncbi:response regulator [Massilia arenosa]|uniref:histidine kinase n=1 Tax=Zemynaea arenosa TaxID=2561931 RepID=A0A4Y9SHD3_9BURK|nr:response regulator [Massilia arenosa]TFW20843.1 response regulator [Massilia arenosa]
MTTRAPDQLILNVDDTDAARYAKTRILSRAGYQVIEAGTGAEAIAMARTQNPMLVLLDTRLPDINGFEVCRQLKDDPATRHILVLQTSASFVGTTDKVRALDTGADNYLFEPIEPEELIANVRALLRLGRVERELREVDRRKDEFLAILAHELRNPLGPIRSAVELLRHLDPYAPPAQENARQMIIRQTDHMVRLVDDLLDVSRISQGKITVHKAPLRLHEVVLAAIETANPAIKRGDHSLAVSLPDDDIWVEGDAVRLAQAVANLLNNAGKFTPRGGQISISALAENGEAVIRVADNGIGIAPEQKDQIFTLFAQGRHTDERVKDGLGIGLSLVRTLVELHGGTVGVSSPGAGQGSIFEIRLPLTAAATAAAPVQDEAPAPSTKRRVLVVDDNRDSADMLASLLEFAGHEVATANDGTSALARAAEFRPQLAFLDIGLPDMTGYALAGAIRKIAGLEQIALVALTGYGQQKDRDDALAGGFNQHLTKPVSYETLVETIERFLPAAQ